MTEPMTNPLPGAREARQELAKVLAAGIPQVPINYHQSGNSLLWRMLQRSGAVPTKKPAKGKGGAK